MSFAISPIHDSSDFPKGITLDDKIDIFIARVDGWQLGVAREMIDRNVGYRAFALLMILTSYFEMIAKYRDGYTGARQSGRYFKKGLKYTFPEIDPDDKKFLDSFYKNVRNGLYHVGMTKTNVILSGDIPKSLGYAEERDAIAINPDTLVTDLQIRFGDFSAELKDKSNQELRSNFERRFDLDNA